MESTKIIELWEEGNLPSTGPELESMKDILIQDIKFIEEWISATKRPIMIVGLNFQLTKCKTVLELIRFIIS